MKAILAVCLLFAIAFTAIGEEVISVTELDPMQRDERTDVPPIGTATIVPSIVFPDGGVELRAPSGDTMYTIRLLIEADKESKALRLITELKGRGWITVVNTEKSTGKDVVPVIYHLKENGIRSIDLTPASEYINSSGFVEIHFSVSDNQYLHVGHIILESLDESPPPKEIIRNERFPQTHCRRTIFHAVYNGPIILGNGVIYDNWWRMSSYRSWLTIVRPRIVYVRVARPVIYLYQEEPLFVVRIRPARSRSRRYLAQNYLPRRMPRRYSGVSQPNNRRRNGLGKSGKDNPNKAVRDNGESYQVEGSRFRSTKTRRGEGTSTSRSRYNLREDKRNTREDAQILKRGDRPTESKSKMRSTSRTREVARETREKSRFDAEREAAWAARRTRTSSGTTRTRASYGSSTTTRTPSRKDAVPLTRGARTSSITRTALSSTRTARTTRVASSSAGQTPARRTVRTTQATPSRTKTRSVTRTSGRRSTVPPDENKNNSSSSATTKRVRVRTR